MPLLWIVLGVAGIAFWWKMAHRFPSINPNADALTLLNFPPYTLQSGKNTYTIFMSPEGLTPAQVVSVVSGSATSVRKHIPLPGPTTVPAFAELWAVQTMYTGTPTTVSPSAVLQEQFPLPAAANIDPARALAAALYAAAFSPTIAGKSIFVPIAAKQS